MSTLRMNIAEAINASKNDTDATKLELIEAIEAIIASTSTKKDEHPPKDIDGELHVWCIKHNTYELATEFAEVPKSKTGYHNKCKIADLQWKDYLKQIKESGKIKIELDNKLINTDNSDVEAMIEAIEEIKQINDKIEQLSVTKDGAYHYPDSEEIDRISPKRKTK